MELLDRLGLKPDTFAGRVAVVTGAARGIGEQVARGLAHLGARVIILDILDEGEKTAERIQGNARNVRFAQVDLRDVDALTRALHRLMSENDLAGRLGTAGRSRVEKKFDIRTQGQGLRDLYLKVAAESKR